MSTPHPTRVVGVHHRERLTPWEAHQLLTAATHWRHLDRVADPDNPDDPAVHALMRLRDVIDRIETQR